jgi:hypothetical protein
MEDEKRMKKITFILAVALLVAGMASANTLVVNNDAAQEGNFGLEITMEAGTTDPAYVRDNTPDGETIYRAQFWVDRSGGLFMSNAGNLSTRFVTFRAADDNHNGGGTTVTVFRGIMGRLAVDGPDGPRYSFRLGCRKDNGSFQYIGGIVLGELAQRKWVTVEFAAASSDGANDGLCRLYQGNQKYVANLVGQNTTMDNDLHEIDWVHLGAISGFTDNPNDPDTVGPLYYDSFESFRSLLP